MCVLFLNETMNREKWIEFSKGMHKNDEVYIKSLDIFADSLDEFYERIELLNEKNIKVFIEDFKKEIDPVCMLLIVERVKYLKQKDLQSKQMAGIKQALIKKKEGIGNYGRPSAKLPKNFEENVLKIIEKDGVLSDYAKSLDMPLSTFYKYVSAVRDNQILKK